jgi:RNA-directed DNA polymerase
MNRWNPTQYLKEGQSKNFDTDYLDKLLVTGRKIQSFNIPVIFSLSHLANLSNTRYSDLHEFVSRSKDSPYRNFTIKKRSGGKRWISVPAPSLMATQGWIAKNILNNVIPHKTAFAYVINRKIIEHTRKHCAADWILKIDIKDFFSNISERQVFKVFESLGYPNLLAFEMARLCTRETPRRKGKRWSNRSIDELPNIYQALTVGSLPQGAPTSPALSNLVCIKMDEQLEALALEVGATYSRYADDLCFSFSSSTHESILEIKKNISKILHNQGFEENLKKTRIIPPGARKIVTGLLINSDVPKIPKEIRNNVRMHLYYSKKFGIPSHCRNKGFRSVIGFRNHLYGLIRYIYSINQQQGEKFLAEFLELPWINFEI